MASSTPSTPEPAPSALPRQEILDTIAAQIAALDELVGLARHSIRVFDIDLSEMGWNGVARAEKLGAFLRGSRNARLDIIVHDTRYIEGSCARLRNLQSLFGQAITICRTGPEAKGAMDPLVIVDGRHFLHRFHIEQPRAVVGIEQLQAAKPLVHKFEEIWATGEVGVTANVLGL